MKLIPQNENKPGYKETKIGWIPDGWGFIEFDKIADLSKEKFDPKKTNTNHRCIELEHIDQNTGTMNGFINSVDQKSIKNKFYEGQILFGKLRPYLRKYYLSDFTGVCSTEIWVLKPNGVCHGEYLFQLIQTEKFNKVANVSSGTKMPRADWNYVSKFPFLLPPLPVQKKFATILSTWDSAIEKTTDLITAKEQQKKGLMQKLLSGEVRFPGFTEPWQEVSIGSLVKEIDRDITWDDNKEYKLISVRRRSGGLFHRENLIGHQIKTKTLKKIQTNDFLISKMQIVHGASGLTTNEFDEMYVSASYHCLVPKNEELIDIEFFNYFSQLPWFYHLTYLASHGVHIEKMTFKLKDLLKFKILIPTEIREQKKIVKVINGVGNEIKLLKNEKAALEQQKKGLMQKLLTGTVRVKPIKN